MEGAPMPEGEGQEAGAMTKKAQQAGQLLAELSEALNASPAATDADREKMAMVMNGFIELVESNLGGQAPGEDAPAEPEQAPPMVSAEGGIKGQPAGPHMR